MKRTWNSNAISNLISLYITQFFLLCHRESITNSCEPLTTRTELADPCYIRYLCLWLFLQQWLYVSNQYNYIYSKQQPFDYTLLTKHTSSILNYWRISLRKPSQIFPSILFLNGQFLIKCNDSVQGSFFTILEMEFIHREIKTRLFSLQDLHETLSM